MKPTCLRPHATTLRCWAAIACVVASAWVSRAQDEGVPDWARHFRLGGVVGFNLRADFQLNGQFSVSGADQAGPVGVSGANHIYDDGYVRVDNTGNAQGYTSFWGYQNAAQYDAANQRLVMRSSSSFGLTDSTQVEGDPQAGFDLAYGGHLMRVGGARLGWDLGFTWLPVSITDHRALSTVFTRKVHAFDTAGIVLPDAPYNGGASGIGPTIHDVATALPDETSPGTLTGSRTLDVTLYNVRLGPWLHWQLGPQFAFSLGAGGAVGIASTEYNYNETIVFADGSQAPNRGSFGRTQVVYGGYVETAILYRTPENADVYIGARFMTLGDTSISSQGRSAQLELGTGLYLTAGINWPF